MCRLLAFVFNENSPSGSVLDVVNSFRDLAITGAVPKTIDSGHEDGWGIALYRDNDRDPVVYKSTKSAKRDEEFSSEFLSFKSKGTGIAHLRKKTVGEPSLDNTHPFTSGSFSFIHNGTVTKEKEGPYPELSHLCLGATDSERLFQRTLQIKKEEGKDLQSAFAQMLTETREKYPMFSALNSIFCDGETLYVARYINEESSNYNHMGYDEYYSLYLGKANNGSLLVSSEQIEMPGIEYSKIRNYSLTVITTRDNKVLSVSL